MRSMRRMGAALGAAALPLRGMALLALLCVGGARPAATAPPGFNDIRGAMCKDICASISGLDTFYEGSCYCILDHEPMKEDSMRVEQAVQRGKEAGMPVTTTVVGYDRSRDREERCLMGLATALRARSGSAARARASGLSDPVVRTIGVPMVSAAAKPSGAPDGGAVVEAMNARASVLPSHVAAGAVRAAGPPGTVPVLVLSVAPVEENSPENPAADARSRQRERAARRLAAARSQAAGVPVTGQVAAASAPAPRYAQRDVLVSPVQTGVSFLESPTAAFSSMAGPPPRPALQSAVNPVNPTAGVVSYAVAGAPFSGVLTDGAQYVRSAAQRAADTGREAAHFAVRQAADLASTVTGAGLGVARNAVSGGRWAADTSLRTADDALGKAEAMASAALRAQMRAADQTVQYLLPPGGASVMASPASQQQARLSEPMAQRLLGLSVMNPGSYYPVDSMQSSGSSPQMSILSQRSVPSVDKPSAALQDSVVVTADLSKSPVKLRAAEQFDQAGRGLLVDVASSAASGVEDAYHSVASGVQSGLHTVGDLAQGAASGIQGGVQTGLQTVGNLANGVSSGVESGVHTATDLAHDAYQGLSSGVQTGVSTATNVAQDVYQGVASGVQTGVSTTSDLAQGAYQGVQTGVNTAADLAGSAYQGVASGVQTGMNTASNLAQGAYQGASTGMQKGTSTLSGVASNIMSAAKGLVKQTAQSLQHAAHTLAGEGREGVRAGARVALDGQRAAATAVTALEDALQAAASQAVQAVRTVEGAAAQGVQATQSAQQAALRGVQDAADRVQGQLQTVAGEVQGQINDAAGRVRGQVQTVAGEGVEAVRGVKDAAKSVLLDSAAEVQGQVHHVQQTVRDSVLDAQQAARDAILAAASYGSSQGQQVSRDVVDAAQGAVSSAIDKVRGTMGVVNGLAATKFRQGVGSMRSPYTPAFQGFEQSFQLHGFQPQGFQQQGFQQQGFQPQGFQQGLQSFEAYPSTSWAQQAIDGIASDAVGTGLRAAGAALQTPGRLGRLGLGATRDGLGMAKAAIGALPLGLAGRSAAGLGLSLAASGPAKTGSAAWSWSPSSSSITLDGGHSVIAQQRPLRDPLHEPVIKP